MYVQFVSFLDTFCHYLFGVSLAYCSECTLTAQSHSNLLAPVPHGPLSTVCTDASYAPDIGPAN